MKKSYVALRRRGEVKQTTYSSKLREFSEDVPHGYNIIENIRGKKYPSFVKKVSTFGVIKMTEKEALKLNEKIVFLKIGLDEMVRELKEIHDQELFRLLDLRDKSESSTARKMRNKGKMKDKEDREFLKEIGHLDEYLALFEL